MRETRSVARSRSAIVVSCRVELVLIFDAAEIARLAGRLITKAAAVLSAFGRSASSVDAAAGIILLVCCCVNTKINQARKIRYS